MRELTSQQQEAVEKFRRLKVGALFMECGTGKTQAAVSIIDTAEDVDLLLWVCPCQTKTNLQEELNKCGCRYKADIVGVESIGQSNRIFIEVLENVKAAKKAFIVVDESIKIKNMRAKRTKRLLRIAENSEYRLILNGTPITRNICDIYAQMHFLSPKILDISWIRYRDNYCTYKQYKRNGVAYKTIITGYANIDHLLSIIGPYIFQCSLNVPIKKNYHCSRWDMTRAEKEAYYNLKQELFQEVNDYGDIDILGILQKLQHSYCCSEDKFNVLSSIITDKSIVYCRFIRSQKAVQERFPHALVLTYGKGSFGLNLQAYNRVIYFDKTWDYAFREQSEARIYRTGQREDCEYYDMTGDVGLDELIDRCISKKLSLVDYFKEQGKKILEKL